MDRIKSILGRRRTRSQTSNSSSSASSSRRHSVSEHPQPVEEDLAAPRSDQLLLGGVGSSSMRFTGQDPPPPRRTTRSRAPPPYEPKLCEYGFMLTKMEEEDKLNYMKGRVMANFDFDDDALAKMGLLPDVHALLENLGWRQFAEGVSSNLQVDIALEMFVTMEKTMKVVGEAYVPCLTFRIKNRDHFITYAGIEDILGFPKGAPELVHVEDKELNGFWHKIAVDENRVRKNISNITLRIFHSWMSKRILGRMREHKVTDRELNWLYSGLVKKERINPTHTMVERWVCEAISGTGDVGSGCYLTQIAHVIAGGFDQVPKFLFPGVAMDIEHLKRGHYIGGNEQHGYTVAETNLQLPDARLQLFSAGRTDWRDEDIGKKARKNKRGKTIEGSTSRQENAPSGVGVPQGWESSREGMPAPPPVYAPPPPPSTYGFPPPHQGVFIDPSFGASYSHLPQPRQGMSIIGAYATRNEQDIAAIRTHTSQLESGTAGIIYEMGRLGLAPPDQYEGGYYNFYEQGFNARTNEE